MISEVPRPTHWGVWADAQIYLNGVLTLFAQFPRSPKDRPAGATAGDLPPAPAWTPEQGAVVSKK